MCCVSTGQEEDQRGGVRKEEAEPSASEPHGEDWGTGAAPLIIAVITRMGQPLGTSHLLKNLISINLGRGAPERPP